ncbi:MAG: STAS domain-containing protein [Azospirillum sp.]|nr:STAS domain-containing protein [Azospirillum sp.]
MEYEINKRPGITEFRLKGRMGFTDHSQFKDLMSAFGDEDKAHVVFNLDQLNGIDSSGLGMFLIARDEAGKRGLSLSLERPHSEVKRLLELARFDRHFDIRP